MALVDHECLKRTAEVVRWTARARQLVEAAQPILEAAGDPDEPWMQLADDQARPVLLTAGDVRRLQRAVDAALDAMHTPGTGMTSPPASVSAQPDSTQANAQDKRER